MKKVFRIWILTVLPDYFKSFKDEGVVGQLLSGKRGEKNFELNIVNIRDYGRGNYNAVDDYPFGGGPGMILRPDILEQALMDGVVTKGGYQSIDELEIIYTSARGKLWSADEAKNLEEKFWREDSKKDLVFLCGRYEGVDERFLEKFVNSEYSLGHFVLTGGELAVMAILDSALRFTQGSLGNSESCREDSYEDGLLDYPQFTRPSQWQGISVPEVLISGHHANIEKWKKEQKLEQTKKYKPEILKYSGSKNEK